MKLADLFYNLVFIDDAHEPGLHPNLQSRLWFWEIAQSSDTSDLCKVLGTECLGPCPARRSQSTCWLPCWVLFSHSCLQDDLAITTLLAILNNKPQEAQLPQQDNLYKYLINPSMALNPHFWKGSSLCWWACSRRPSSSPLRDTLSLAHNHYT